MRLKQFVFSSTVLGLLSFLYAIYLKKTFLLASIYLTQNALTLLILVATAISLVVLLGQAFTTLFFGQLRPIEAEVTLFILARL